MDLTLKSDIIVISHNDDLVNQSSNHVILPLHVYKDLVSTKIKSLRDNSNSSLTDCNISLEILEKELMVLGLFQ